MEGTATYTLATLLQDVGSIFTAMVGWVQKVIEMITSNPILLVFVIFSLIFGAVAMVRRLIRI